MTKISQIEDRGATVAWSPISNYADVIALGAKDSGGIGFDSTGGELELYDINIASNSSPSPAVLGSVKTTSRFASIGWTSCDKDVLNKYPMGLLAGGMVDGTVHIWDPSLIAKGQGERSQLSTISDAHTPGSSISALRFNPHINTLPSTLLASGDTSGKLVLSDLLNPSNPTSYNPADPVTTPVSTAEITQVAWNTQVSHILASSSAMGTVSVYDTRQKKIWCEIRADSSAVSDVAWNPNEGLHLITASSDDRNPVMKLWDLRASTSMPLATLSGHSAGILSLAWCAHDDGLLVSCGKDNKTLLWDLYSLEPILEIANEEGGEGGGIYGLGGSSQQKRYDVQWSSVRRGVLSTCSFDRKVQVHSVVGAAAKTGRTPKWLKRPCGVSCGFGGSVISFGSENRGVTVDTVVEEPNLKQTSEAFEQSVASKDFIGYCNSKSSMAEDVMEAKVWGFMQIIFEANAREQLLHYLGFNPEDVTAMSSAFCEAEEPEQGIAEISLDEKPRKAGMSKKTEELIQKSLLVGNFEAAVDICFKTGDYADGLVLSSCGGAELWAKTQTQYFALEAKKRPFLSLVSAVIHNKLDDLVANSSPEKWQETLAILSTYGKSDEFPALCLALGDRLEQSGDFINASLCHMCGLNLDCAVHYWKIQLQQANLAKGKMDVVALHSFVERVEVFLNALEPNTPYDASVADLFAEYAQVLTDQTGELVTASKYCRGETQACMELRDRLYNSRFKTNCRGYIRQAPPFPFEKVTVGLDRGPQVKPQQVQQQPQQQPQQQQYGQQPQQQQYGQQPQQVAPTPQQQQPSDQLAPGWSALQDPSSGMTYYANQTTGVTQWDKPLAPAPQVPVPQPTPQPVQQQQAYQTNGHYNAYAQPNPQTTMQAAQPQPQQQVASVNGGNTGAMPVNKYGDGFVTSSSHPELAQQYGNVNTSSPYGEAGARPGIAIVNSKNKAPISGNLDPNCPPPLSPELQPISDILLSFLSFLSTQTLSSTETRQLAELKKGIAILLKKLSRGDISSEIAQKVMSFVYAIRDKDYPKAGSIQTGMVANDWREHKDWLKGMKNLIHLGSKRAWQ